MEEFFTKHWNNLTDRIDGPMSLRFILQPMIAIFFGIRDGLRFAREGRTFLIKGGPKDPAERRAQLRDTCRSIGKVVILAIVLDVIYQIVVATGFYPVEALIVAVIVAIAPYLAVREIMNALGRHFRSTDTKP